MMRPRPPLIGVLLQLGERPRLAPPKHFAEIAKPAEQIVGAHLLDRVAEQGFYPPAVREVDNCALRPQLQVVLPADIRSIWGWHF